MSPAESTGKKDKKGKAHFPFLIFFPCTFGNMTDQQNLSETEIAANMPPPQGLASLP
ncbi:Uncharacterized protein dnm_024880 [Desulfonema magnum]|uniref:Uncharacterized protein n=1 Tax=Desulfonema magnum TaxID=45655 RepID=A0A975BJE0_9BACT|nr:Uncharacterized protein dnm_024880 [Desulfonema magnum]